MLYLLLGQRHTQASGQNIQWWWGSTATFPLILDISYSPRLCPATLRLICSLKSRSKTCCSQLDSEITVDTRPQGGAWGLENKQQHLITPSLGQSPLLSVSPVPECEFSTVCMFFSRRHPQKYWAVISFFNQSCLMWHHYSYSTKSFQTCLWVQLFNYLCFYLIKYLFDHLLDFDGREGDYSM